MDTVKDVRHIKNLILQILRQYPRGITRGQLLIYIPFRVPFDAFQLAVASLEKDDAIVVVRCQNDKEGKNNSVDTFSDKIALKRQSCCDVFDKFLAKLLKPITFLRYPN